MNSKIIMVIALFMGVIIGMFLPISVCHKCNTPIFAVCNHCFWDWFLRVLQVFGTLSAVFVALFKEWIYQKLYHPTITFKNGKLSETYDNANNVNQYFSTLQITNNGSANAVNCELFISNLEFSSNNNDLRNTIISTDTALRWEDNEKRVDISQDCTKAYEWFRLVKGIPSNGETAAIPNKLIIGNKEIPSNMSNGRFDVTFKVACQGCAPQKVKLQLSWNGQWQEHMNQMTTCLQTHIV